MTEEACILDEEQRRVVAQTIAEHCRIRGWDLHAVNCRTNHLHVVVTANRKPDEVRDQFKAWSTRKLKELEQARTSVRHPGEIRTHVRQKWWAERGSCLWIFDADGLEAVIRYVLEGQ